jgi:hypothetical protein
LAFILAGRHDDDDDDDDDDNDDDDDDCTENMLEKQSLSQQKDILHS